MISYMQNRPMGMARNRNVKREKMPNAEMHPNNHSRSIVRLCLCVRVVSMRVISVSGCGASQYNRVSVCMTD